MKFWNRRRRAADAPEFAEHIDMKLGLTLGDGDAEHMVRVRVDYDDPKAAVAALYKVVNQPGALEAVCAAIGAPIPHRRACNGDHVHVRNSDSEDDGLGGGYL